jgi:arginyl-tRNA--protein-N-Asp/Glu arginylyltransferase
MAAMKIFFSESKSDYSRYLYQYVVWATPEAGEVPADLFNAGFLPSAKGLHQFVLCRNVRVDLAKFSPSSENRRILRKGAGITMKLVPRAEFDFSPVRQEYYLKYAEVRYGKDVMPLARLELVFNSPVCTHLLVFTDDQSGAEIGTAVMYLEEKRLAFYRYSFFDLGHPNRSLGLFLMTTAVEYFAAQKFNHLYLGTCYSERALYKTQFAGVEFFNGFRWSPNLAELKFLLQREQAPDARPLLETENYLADFYAGQLENVFSAGGHSAKAA